MWVHLSRLFGKEKHQTSLEGKVPERKTGAVPKGSGVDVAKMCYQVFSPQYSFGCSHQLTLSGGYYVSHFRAEEMQIFLSGSPYLIEMPGAQEHCWSYLVLCPYLVHRPIISTQ